MADWIAAKDKRTGRTYYANIKTQESRWTPPPGFTGRSVDELSPSAQQSNGSHDPGDDRSESALGGAGGGAMGRSFGGGSVGGDSPANGMGGGLGVRGGGGRGGGGVQQPIETKHTYGVEPRRLSQPQQLPQCNWKSIKDENSGRFYYYHIQTRQTSWQKPDEYKQWEEAKKAIEDGGAGGGGGVGGGGADDHRGSLHDESTRAIAQSVQLDDDFFGEEEEEFNSHHNGRDPNGYGDPGGGFGADAFANLAPDSSGDEEEYDSDEEAAGQFAAPTVQQDAPKFGQREYKVVETFQQKEIVTAEQFNKQVEEEMDQLLVTSDGGEDGDYYQSLAITQGDRFKLENYGTTYFNKHKKGMFGGKCTVMEMIAWTGKLLPTSLKKLNSALAEESKQAFKNIMSYMEDRTSSKKPMSHAKKLLKQAIGSPEELRDEIYCQLCKQTTNNPKPESCIKGWKLMCICVGIFPPSEEFACYLSSYFHDRSQEPGEVGAFATHCLKKLDRTMIEGTRKYCPTEMEIEASEQRKPVSVRVEFLDGTFRSLLVEPQTLVKQVAGELVKGMDIENEKSFALSEMEDEPPDDPVRDQQWLEMMEKRKADQTPGRFKQPIDTLLDRFLEKDERILDVLGGWEHSNSELPKEQRKTYRLVFKIRLFHRDEEEEVKSDQARRLYFVQAANDVVQGYYPIEEKDSLELAALQLQANFGVNEESFYAPGLILDKIQKYVPKKYRTKREHTYLENKILTEHEKFVTLSKTEAQVKYLSIVKKYQTYGCTFFTALRVSRVRKSKDPGEDVVIGISERGLVMLDPVTRNLNHDFELSEILTYGFKDNSFLLVAGNLMQQKKFNFRSLHGREMHDLLRIYIARLVQLQQ